MTPISATEVRGNFSEVLGRVAYGKERVAIARRGRPVAALVPVEDLERLESGAGDGPDSAEELLRAVGESLPGTVYRCRLHPDGRVTYSHFSSDLRETLGLDPEQVTERSEMLAETVHPEDRERRRQAIAMSARKLEPYDVEYRCITPQGEIKWLHAIARPQRHDDGEVTWTGLVLDITKWKRTEVALRESEARLGAILDHAPVEIYLKDAEGRLLEVNRHYEEMWGTTCEQVRGKLPVEIYDDAAFVEASRGHDLAVLESGRVLEREDDIERGDGRHSLHVIKFPIRDETGRITGLGAIASDVTERKKAEEALQRAQGELEQRVEERTRELHATNRTLEHEIATRKEVEARLRESERDLLNLIEGSIQGVLIVTKARVPRFANRACAEIFGYASPDEILALGSTLPLIAPHEVPRLDVLRKTHFADAEAPTSYECDGVRKDGAIIRLQCMARTMDWRGERVAQITLYDITERKRAEEELARSEERLRQATELAGLGHCIWDLVADHCLFCSEEYARIHGVTTEEYIARSTLWSGAFSHPDDRDAYRAAIQELRRGDPFEMEYRLLTPAGEVRYVRELAKPIFDETGVVTREICTIQDITEQKLAEKALRESEERFRDMTSNVPGVVYQFRLDGEGRPSFPYVSPTLFEITGLRPEDVTADALVWMDLVYPEDKAEFEASIARSAQSLAPWSFEGRMVRTSGELLWIRGASVPRRLEDGSILWNGLVLDVTGRKQAEETVRTRDAWLRAILENSPIEIALKDTEGRIMAISRNAGDVLGVPMDEFVGRTTADFLPQEVAETYMAADREVVETGRTIQQDIIEDWDGTIRHYVSSKFPLRDDDGHIIGVCSLTRDVTEAKLAEERMRQAQKMEAVGQLTGGVAHDFNNLLAVIVGNAELLGRKLGKNDRQVSAVLRAAGRGAELIQRLLAFSRRQPLKPQAIDLAARVAGMTELLARTLGATIEISVSTVPGLWRASADPGQLENALLNLAINARHAMPEGGKLSISTANANLDSAAIAAAERGGEPSGAAPGNYVVLAVSDTGTGMSPAVLAHVFEPFFTTKDVGEGSGLGLSMVYGFARQSGGFVAIDTVAGGGTTVRLYLPRAEAAAAAAGAPTPSPAVPRGHGETVLVLEDAQDVRELAVAMLEDLGYRVLAAAEANEAGAVFVEHPEVELLLTDVILPGGRSGPDFAETACRKNPQLKVLFMSGYPTEELMQREDDFGQDVTLIRKPFRKADLARAMREAFDRRDGTDPPRGNGVIDS